MSGPKDETIGRSNCGVFTTVLYRLSDTFTTTRSGGLSCVLVVSSLLAIVVAGFNHFHPSYAQNNSSVLVESFFA